MRKIIALALSVVASAQAQTITQTFGSGANTFSIDFVEIGNPGNDADSRGVPNPVGSVSYVFNLGKYEISRDQIEKANAAGALSISLNDMTGVQGNGINSPATGLSWFEAARFVNYLNTSKGYQAAYNFDGSGNFQLWGAGQYSGTNQYRHKDAFYFLPTVHEWYKAAYYDPNKVGGAGYWNFPTGSDSEPNAVSGGTTEGTAVYSQPGPADITNAGGLSPYGTMAQGGNVWEWLDTAYDGSNDSETEIRELRGGNWGYFSVNLEATTRGWSDPANEYSDYGLRVASVPEPSSLFLLLAGGVLFLGMRNTRKNKI